MQIIVYGQPAPQGSKKFLGNTKSGRGIIVENSTKTKPWRSDVMAAASLVMEREQHVTFEGAVAVRLAFSFWRPASVKPNKRPYPSVAPDLAKLARAVEDALTGAGIWKDDCLIVHEVLSKHYCGEDDMALDHPGCIIIVQEMKGVDELTWQRN